MDIFVLDIFDLRVYHGRLAAKGRRRNLRVQNRFFGWCRGYLHSVRLKVSVLTVQTATAMHGRIGLSEIIVASFPLIGVELASRG
jgi:hypothetical protein